VASIDATVTNNTVTTNGADAAIQVYLSDLNGTNNRVCLSASGNATQANGGAFGETDFFFGNDAISGSNSGIALMQGYSTSVSNTWFNVNGNTSTTLPTPLADSLGPIGPGSCAVVAQSAPAQSNVLLAQAETGAPRTLNVLAATSAALSRVNVGAALSAATQWVANLAPALGAAPALASGETVSLNLGDLNPGQVVLITFDVMVDHTIPSSVTLVCNQASFSGANFITLLTDDIDLPGSADPTCTAVDIANAAPVADDDSYSTNEDTALSVAAPGVLDGDTDANNDALTAVLDSGPSNGTLTLNSDGSFNYTPNAGYCGTDSFTYYANDGQADSNVATVTLSVVCVIYLPVILAN